MENKLNTLNDFQTRAVDELMSKNSKLYFSAGAGYRTTPPYNEEAFQRYFIRPRVLRDVSEAKLDCRVLDTDAACPIGVSPTAMHTLVHPEGELASAAGCCDEGCIFVMSSAASRTIEEVGSYVQKGRLWMQIYIHEDRETTLELVRKAESFGFSALVVTVDSPVSGLWRGFMPEDFFTEAAFRMSNLSTTPRRLLDKTVTFEDLKWLKENTHLPFVVKGILSGKDAEEAARCGASAVLVSNHGGRMIQRVVPTIHVLEEVVEAVRGTGVEVYLDGGVRSGSDVFVALALGAKAVFIGRPIVWGLCVNGEDGVREVLSILKDELLRTMQLTGAVGIRNIERSMVERI